MFYNKDIFKSCFHYSGTRWYKNVAQIPRYLRRIHHLVKYGYDMYACWETFDWFINTMRLILVEYRHRHISYPVITGAEDDKERWDEIIDTMINLLNDMDECNVKYDDMDIKLQWKLQEDAKDKFFELFSEYFYTMWD